MVWRLLAANLSTLERLLGRDGPVAVNLMLDLLGQVVVLAELTGGGEAGLVGELVLDTAADDDGVSLNTLEVLPAVGGLEGVGESGPGSVEG